MHLQVWNASEETTLYSAKHDAQVHELFSLQDDMAAGLRNALGVHMGSVDKKAEAPPTSNPQAYELFLRAAERLARLNRWDTRTAIEMLEQAVELDPKFADAWQAGGSLRAVERHRSHPRWLKRASEAVAGVGAGPPQCRGALCRARLLWTPAQKFKNRPALRPSGGLHINPVYAAQILAIPDLLTSGTA